MSSDMNQEVFRRVISEVFNKGNYSVLPELFHPDFIEHQFGLHATFKGMESDVSKLRSSFPDLNLTIEEMVSEGETVWARMTSRGTNRGGFMGPPNGKPFAVTVFDMCKYRDGKIVEHWGCPDRFALMIQLGLVPQPKEAVN
jgi:predicted ester cyclase